MLKISALLFKLLKENKHSGAKANPDGMVSYPDLIRFHIVSARNTLFLPTPPSRFTETILYIRGEEILRMVFSLSRKSLGQFR